MSLDFCAVLDDLNRSHSAVDANGVVRSGLLPSTLNNILTIRALVMGLKPTNTIEIGLAAGASALTFAASHRDLGAKPNRQHIAIDPYQSAFHYLGATLLERATLGDYVEIIGEASHLALPSLLREERQFQLAYIDGSHAFHQAFFDFYYLRHLMREGGVILLDDCALPSIWKLIRFIRRNLVSVAEFDLTPFRPPSAAWRDKIAHMIHRSQCLAFQRTAANPHDDEKYFRRF
jgi:predicted O-methyltransferase YrrM